MNLGDRMKRYELASKQYLPIRTPVIIRVDGKAFHTYTRGADKPFDDDLLAAFRNTLVIMCNEIGGCVLGYHQSDEMSFLLVDYKQHDTQAWFDNNVQKLCSISASLATAHFNECIRDYMIERARNGEHKPKFTGPALFDARAFIIPKEDVCNYFIWRQKDWERNSLQMLARAHYSHRELEGKKREDLHELLHQKGVNWNDLPTYLKRGSCAIPSSVKMLDDQEAEQTLRGWVYDWNIPIFTQDRWYIERLVYPPTEEDNEC